MADYKDYIVRYDIQADVTKAAEGLQSIAKVAKEFEAPMRELSNAIRQVSQSAFQLKQNSNITFTPKIDVGAFNNQLRSMVLQVRNAATEMHTALFESLTNNAAATKAMQKGVGAALKNAKPIKDLKSDIEAYNKELDKLLGSPKKNRKGETVRERDGAIQMAKNANMHERVIELESRKRMFQQLIKQRKAELATAEQFEKEVSTQQAKTDSKIKSSVTDKFISQSQPAKLTNVTPAVIKEWKKAFGDSKSKSLTIDIKANAGGANGALTIIRQVQSALETLQTKGSFNIKPVLNMEAFASIESQFKRLASLSASVTAPFIAKDEQAQGAKLGSPITALSKDEKLKLSEAKKQIKTWNDKIASIQSRLDFNKTKYEQNPTPGLKGQITRDTRTLEKYKANRVEQENIVQSIQSKTPTAVQHATKGIKSLSIDIIGNLKSIHVVGKTPVVPIVGELTKLQGKITEAIPVNVKIMADQVAASIKSIPTPTLNVNVRLNTDGIREQLQSTKPVTVSAKSVKNGATNKGVEQQKIVKSAVGVAAKIDTKDIVNQIKSIPRQIIPVSVKLMWERGVIGRQEQLKNLGAKIPPIVLKLDTTAAVAKLEEFIALIKANSLQNIKLTTSGVNGSPVTTIASPTAPATSLVASKKVQGGVTGKTAFTAQDRYAIMKERAFQKAAKDKSNSKITVQKWQDEHSKQQAWHTQQQAMYNRLFEAVPKPDYGWAKRIEEQRASELATMREDAKSAFAKLTPFEKQEVSAHNADVANSIAKHQRQADKLRAQAYNSMLPFAKNKEQLNMLAKHRKFFNQAVSATGITPTPGMETSKMLKYLQGVSTQMQQSNVAVPWQLQNQINKLEGDIAKVNNIKQVSSRRGISVPENQKPFFDQARKWGYPLTGNTSFGASTPMAVDMAKGAGVMFAVGGAMSAISNAFNEAVEYQNTMRTTQSILKHGTDSYTLDSFKNMERTVRDVGIKTKFSSSEVADAAKFLAMAGYNIDAINASISPIADLALIGDSDLGETADKMTNIMTTFQIAPNRMREAANIMATTATRSNTDLMMLAESAKYGGGVANMYGRNDPNLFGDTMALFGVMGNAGIQASSAGTALRMMYMNLFNPNKKQQAMLDMLESTYGIKRFKEDGSYRAMSDILIDMAQRVPENRMAEVVGSLFRITAQPGANAALIAAAGGDPNNEQEIVAGVNSVGDKLLNEGLSPLISLMKANRESMGGNISGDIAEDKQNTLKGLWAQVTSTFEESILVALENRLGEFEKMLKQLSNYLAKPETMRMMQNLLDMIIDVGKVMAGFVKVWANIYNAVPGLIKSWIVAQMFITQLGTLISPVISLIGVFDRFGSALMKFAGVSMGVSSTIAKSATGRTVTQIANAASYSTPFVVGTGKLGQNQTIRGNIASRANRELAENAILAGELALSGASKSKTLESLNQDTRKHYAEVRQRANRMYGPSRAWRVFKNTASTLPTVATFAPMIGGLKSMFMGLLTSLAKAVGLLVNPVTLAIGAVGALGYGIYKFVQFANGTTETQIIAQQKLAELADHSRQKMVENIQWYQEQMKQFAHPEKELAPRQKSENERDYDTRVQNFQEQYKDLQENWRKGASFKMIKQQNEKWRNFVNANPIYRLALGDDYNKLAGNGLESVKFTQEYVGNESDLGKAIYNAFWAVKDTAEAVQKLHFQAALRTAGVSSPAVKSAIDQINTLQKQFLNKTISEEEYYQKAYEIRDSVANPFDQTLRSSEGLSIKEYQHIKDPSIYRDYHKGQYDLLNAWILGANDTPLAKFRAYDTLKGDITAFSQQWWKAIDNIIGDFTFPWDVMSGDKLVSKMKLRLSMLPDGQIDFNKITEQIRKQVKDFELTTQDFASMAAHVYKMMADAGYVPGDKDSLRTFLEKQLENRNLTPGDIKWHYLSNLPQKPVSNNMVMPLEEYQQYIFKPDGKQWINGEMHRAVDDRQSIREAIINQSVERLFPNTIQAPNIQVPLRPDVKNPTRTTDTDNKWMSDKKTDTDKFKTDVQNQSEYQSHYERSAARPTQVVININELAHFDRTMVASSAEERDLIASMEPKIAEAVYRIFAEASNQAQRIVDQV